MWRGVGLVALVAAMSLAIACGGGGDDATADCIPTIGADNFETVHPPELTPMPLKDAREYADWIKVPADLPDDATITAVLSGYLPCPASVRDAIVVIESVEASFQLHEFKWRGDTSSGVGRPPPGETPVQIGDREGTLRVVDYGLRVIWDGDGMSYVALLERDSEVSRERFLKILESIPE